MSRALSACPHQFCLLTHAVEFSKPTNTGRLVTQQLPGTLVLEWSRVEPPTALLELLQQDDCQPLLVFPEALAIYHADEHCYPESFPAAESKLFIILDATWQQARKIYRQSPYLHTLSIYNVRNPPPSIYSLRRNQQPGHLCTAEVVAQILRQKEQVVVAEQLIKAVTEFCENYQGKKHSESLTR